jgi:type II secretion system protein J
MSSRFRKSGFTLVEILIAMAIIVTVISIVYGSYSVISRSVKTCKARTALSQQGRKVLGLMVRQIRCSYGPTADSSLQQKTISQGNAIEYFSGSSDERGSAALHLVAINAFSSKQNSAGGLFEVDYKLDGKTGALLLNQRPFVGTPTKNQENNWYPIAKNTTGIELEFFDGRQWLHKWNFKDQGQLPAAVRINLAFEDENQHKYRCGAVAYVYCGTNQGKIRPDILMSAGR